MRHIRFRSLCAPSQRTKMQKIIAGLPESKKGRPGNNALLPIDLLSQQVSYRNCSLIFRGSQRRTWREPVPSLEDQTAAPPAQPITRHSQACRHAPVAPMAIVPMRLLFSMRHFSYPCGRFRRPSPPPAKMLHFTSVRHFRNQLCMKWSVRHFTQNGACGFF